MSVGSRYLFMCAALLFASQSFAPLAVADSPKPGIEPRADGLMRAMSDYLKSDGYANYNSLQTSLRKRYSGGLSMNMNYTWSKAMGNTQDNLSGGGGSNAVRPQNAHDLDADYGRLVFDRTIAS